MPSCLSQGCPAPATSGNLWLPEGDKRERRILPVSCSSYSSLHPTLFRYVPALRGHETDLVDAGALGDIDHFHNFVVEQFRIRIDEHDAFVTGPEDFQKGWTQLRLVVYLLIDLDDAVRVHTNDDRLVEVVRIRRRRAWRRRLWHGRIQAFGGQRRDGHEDNQQHEQNINEGSNVDVSLGTHFLLWLAHLAPLPLYLLVDLFGQQTNLVNAGSSQVVHNLDDIPVLRSVIAL